MRRGTFGGAVGAIEASTGGVATAVGKTVRGGAVGRLTGGKVGNGFEADSVAGDGVAVGAGVIRGGVIFRGSWGVMAGATVGFSIGVGLARGGIGGEGRGRITGEDVIAGVGVAIGERDAAIEGLGPGSGVGRILTDGLAAAVGATDVIAAGVGVTAVTAGVALGVGLG